jgi:CheY-like chemotaxis protein
MPEEVRLHCFEPFFTTKGDQHGSGLGLAMVHGIVRRHEGQIEIDSTPGKGTTVTISLLAYDDVQHPESPPSGEECLKSLRVLVVDDEPAVREVLTVCLWEDGHTVDTASDGQEGLAKIQSGGKWDIVLTDRAMPRMNGDQLAAEIRKIEPEMPIVLVTGFADIMGDVGDQPELIDVVVRKPFTLASIRSGIAKAMARRKPQSEARNDTLGADAKCLAEAAPETAAHDDLGCR